MNRLYLLVVTLTLLSCSLLSDAGVLDTTWQALSDQPGSTVWRVERDVFTIQRVVTVSVGRW